MIHLVVLEAHASLGYGMQMADTLLRRSLSLYSNLLHHSDYLLCEYKTRKVTQRIPDWRGESITVSNLKFKSNNLITIHYSVGHTTSTKWF